MLHAQSRLRLRDCARALAAAFFVASLDSGTVEAAMGDCSQPLSSGPKPVASDCLFILQGAVGLQECPAVCICDTNGVGGVTASDALLCLKGAVGLDVTLECDCSSTTTTTTTTLPGPCELLVNGDFEQQVTVSPENGWSFVTTGGSAWHATGGNPGGYFTMNENGALDSDPTLSQSVTGLVIGKEYRIQGEYRSFAPDFGDADKPDAFAVQLEPQPGGQGPTILVELPRPSPDATAWTAFRADFVATGSTETITFVAERDGDDSSFDVDNLCLGER